MLALFATGLAMFVAGDSGGQVFQIVFASGIELITDGLLGFDVDSEGWFRVLGIAVALGSVLVAYLISLVGYFFIDLIELCLTFYGKGGDYFERGGATPAGNPPADEGGTSSPLSFLGPRTRAIDDRSLFGSAASAVVRFLVGASALGLVYAMMRGLFAFYDGVGASVDHGLSKVFVLLVPAAGAVLVLAWVLWMALSKARLREPAEAGGALGLALVIGRLFVELAAITALVWVAAFGTLMVLTGEDVFLIMVGVVGQGIEIATGNIGDLATGGWFGSRVFGLLLACFSTLFGLVYAFAGYVGHDSIEVVVRILQRGGEFFGLGSDDTRG